MSQMSDDVPENIPYTQLQMVWPEHLLNVPPIPHLAPGYSLRTYRKGDEPRFYKVMELAGWPGWNDEKLQPWLARIPSESWFMIIHEESGQIVATAMGLCTIIQNNIPSVVSWVGWPLILLMPAGVWGWQSLPQSLGGSSAQDTATSICILRNGGWQP